MTFDPGAFPFDLDDDGVAWVRQTLAGLTPDQKLAQLLNLLVRGDDAAEIARLQAIGAGSITRHAVLGPDAEAAIRQGFQDAAPVPLLVSADLEGSRMTQPGGVVLPNPLGLAAVDDVAATVRATEILAADGRANGINWSFTPLLDINAAFRSAIVATRSFGSDTGRIRRHALAQIETFQGNGVAATVKHWPGEGYDDRDQHLVTTIIPLSMADWQATFGRLYRDAIDAGVLSVMSAHIAFPAYCRAIGESADAYRPATINRHLNLGLLRGELGFQGLIVSDATPMAGLTAFSPRREHLPEIISEGCDVILFSNDPWQDLDWLREALDDGRLTQDRVDDAVARQLALKARLGLHKGAAAPPERDRSDDEIFAAELHTRVPTLVKDRDGLFPISPQTHGRVLVISGGIINPFVPQPIPFALPEMMRAKGFEVTEFAPGAEVVPGDHDLLLYLFGEETLLTRNNIFIDWMRLMGGFGQAMHRYWHDVPTAMVSFGYPYHLYDAPRVPAYVNAYATTEAMQATVLAAMLGEIPWRGRSPVDPFCGLEDARE